VPDEKVPPKPSVEYEVGWSEESFLAWRKPIMGPKKRGPVEMSKPPVHDPNVDQDSPISCIFGDGSTTEISHVTMVVCQYKSTVFLSVFAF